MDIPPPVNRVYHLAWWQQAFALGFLVFTAMLALTVGRNADLNEGILVPIMPAFFILFPLVGVGMTLFSFTTTVRFTADAIQKHSIFGNTALPFQAIRGRRQCVVRDNEGASTRYLQLVPDDDRLPALKFQKDYNFDDAFFQWFYALRDLDAEGRKAR